MGWTRWSRRRGALVLGLWLAVAGCGDDDATTSPDTDMGGAADAGRRDAGTRDAGSMDLGRPADAEPPDDIGPTDADVDGGSFDGGDALDAGGDPDAGPGGSGDCDADVDCGRGGTCTALVPGGYRVCEDEPRPGTLCTGRLGECCDSMPCTTPGDECIAGPAVPSCGGIMPPAQNQCAADQCKSDADCSPGNACLPANVLGRAVRSCLFTECRTDADCTGGATCAPVYEPCCQQAVRLTCVPPTGSCRRGSDCSRSSYCDTGRTPPMCVMGFPLCPA